MVPEAVITNEAKAHSVARLTHRVSVIVDIASCQKASLCQ